MTRYEAIISGKARLTTLIASGFNLCGQCNTDRKICKAEKNEKCAEQWLNGECGTEFTCNYQKYGFMGYRVEIEQDNRNPSGSDR